jgi:hypothetical protein
VDDERPKVPGVLRKAAIRREDDRERTTVQFCLFLVGQARLCGSLLRPQDIACEPKIAGTAVHAEATLGSPALDSPHRLPRLQLIAHERRHLASDSPLTEHRFKVAAEHREPRERFGQLQRARR